MFDIFALLGLAILAIGAVVLALVMLLRALWRRSDGVVQKCAVLLLALGFIAAPIMLAKAYAEYHLRDRVPAPLEIASVEYQQEKSWGYGPGANETGFVVYRLSEASSAWTVEQGTELGENLQQSDDPWLPTPVDDVAASEDWHRYDNDPYFSIGLPGTHPATVAEYLEKYGFAIPLDPAWVGQADAALNQPGSFYRYSHGGGVTLIDPAGGKVFFFYAG